MTEQRVVVEHRSSGCLTCLVIVLILFVGLPVLAVIFKIGFFVSLIAAVSSMFGL